MNDFINFFKSMKYDRALGPFFGVIFPGITLHGYVEYLSTGLSLYFLRDVINVSILTTITILFIFGILHKKNMILISLYTIEFAILYTFVVGYFDPNFIFAHTFLHVQMIFATMLFAAGTLVHLRHLMILNMLNILFIIVCGFTLGKDYMVWRLVFAGVLVSGGGIIAYAGQKFVLSLFKKIKSARTLIEEQNNELKKMNAKKDQLFGIIGHDLRTPFHQLNQLIDLMDQSNDELKKEEYAQLIKESAAQGAELLEDLLLWSKNIGSGDTVPLEQTSIAKVVDKTFDFFKFNCDAKNITLVNELPQDLMLNISDSMMETVFRNLIGNAIKFSHPNSEILVSGRVKNDHIDLWVKDQGVGISAENLKIFLSEGKILSSLGTQNERGTGYGLGIVKKLVERQQGHFYIDSELEKGTKVILRFPMQAA